MRYYLLAVALFLATLSSCKKSATQVEDNAICDAENSLVVKYDYGAISSTMNYNSQSRLAYTELSWGDPTIKYVYLSDGYERTQSGMRDGNFPYYYKVIVKLDNDKRIINLDQITGKDTSYLTTYKFSYYPTGEIQSISKVYGYKSNSSILSLDEDSVTYSWVAGDIERGDTYERNQSGVIEIVKSSIYEYDINHSGFQPISEFSVGETPYFHKSFINWTFTKHYPHLKTTFVANVMEDSTVDNATFDAYDRLIETEQIEYKLGTPITISQAMSHKIKYKCK